MWDGQYDDNREMQYQSKMEIGKCDIFLNYHKYLEFYHTKMIFQQVNLHILVDKCMQENFEVQPVVEY